MMKEIAIRKEDLRQKILQKRQNWDEALYKEANVIICQSIIDLFSLRLASMDNIGLYWPLKGEPDLLKIAILSKNPVALPKIVNREMIFVRYNAGSPIEESSFPNLYQPQQTIEIIPKWIIVPALAFSLQGYRLGFGFGYYDRYMAKLNRETRPICIGTCFHDNLLENLPFTEQDCKHDYIITDKIIINLS